MLQSKSMMKMLKIKERIRSEYYVTKGIGTGTKRKSRQILSAKNDASHNHLNYNPESGEDYPHLYNIDQLNLKQN